MDRVAVHGSHAASPSSRAAPTRLSRLLAAAIVLVLIMGVVITLYMNTGSQAANVRAVPRVHPPAVGTSVLSGAPANVAAGAARGLFSSAPVVVVASVDTRGDMASAVRLARRAHAPVLLTATAPAAAAAAAAAVLRTEVKALHPRAVLAVGMAGSVLAAQLPRSTVVTGLGSLPKVIAPVPLSHVVLLVHSGNEGPATVAAEATARAAGAQVVHVTGDDPGTDPAAIRALAADQPRQVLAVGASFGPMATLAARIAVAKTGVQLPDGGQVLFPMHRLICLYGHPYTPALGALGEQDLSASIARIKRIAALYRPLSSVPVVPTFEIIATVAQGSPGPGGLYSYETPVAQLRPWIRAATKAGMYVVLDLQPGRANLLAQAKLYKQLLKLPNVGLALDPEWKLQPGQLPLQQIGSVSITEINSVVNWLAALTARYHLPQKLLVLHQFRLSMIQDESQLDTRHGDLAIVIHMDGQGTPGEKLQTWAAVVGAAPPGVWFGWKNFFVKDHPMMTPGETMARRPQPVMISYQ
jgi:hypothetical protein